MRISTSVLPVAETDDLLMDGHLAVSCTLTTNHKQIQTSALIDSGASGYGFIDHSFAHKHSIPLILLNTPWTLEAFDGTPSDYGQITHIARIDNFALDHHEEQTVFLYVTHLHHHAIVLRHPWLQKHDPNIS